MEARKRLLIFDDNPDYGGHQIMAAHAIVGLLEHADWDILGLHHPHNSKNIERWQQIRSEHSEWADRFTIQPSPTQSAKFQAVRRHFQGSALRALKERILSYAPDCILVIQGNIEQGCTLFMLKSDLHCPLVSYIPVPHTHAEMGAKLGFVRDFICRGLYSQPDGFITIAPSLAARLKAYGATGRIEVVENGIDLTRFEAMPDQAAARQQFNLPETGFLWGQIGRVEFKQKGQDKTLSAFRSWLKAHPGDSLVFVGSGPDVDRLKGLADDLASVYFVPWVSDVTPLLSAIDGLMMPSRYEGVPLVMLEALANAKPVVSSKRDGMLDWLPDEWMFDPDSIQSILKAMLAAQSEKTDSLMQLKARIDSDCSLPEFKQNFVNCFSTWS